MKGIKLENVTEKLSKVNWIGVTAAAVAAVSAFAGAISEQKKDALIDDLSKRVSKLEKK